MVKGRTRVRVRTKFRVRSTAQLDAAALDPAAHAYLLQTVVVVELGGEKPLLHQEGVPSHRQMVQLT